MYRTYDDDDDRRVECMRVQKQDKVNVVHAPCGKKFFYCEPVNLSLLSVNFVLDFSNPLDTLPCCTFLMILLTYFSKLYVCMYFYQCEMCI